MIKIAIVDDESAVLLEISQELKNYFEKKSVAYTIQTFTGGIDFLAHTEPFDLAFLDIRMDGLSGIETARQLRENGAKGCIVFITALQEYVYDAFEVEASDYILKPIDPTRFHRTMDRIYRRIQTVDTGSLVIPSKGNSCQVLPFREIYYLEAVNHKIEFHTEDAVLEGYFKVAEIAELLDERFFQCHRSYFVNLDFVYGYDNGRAFLCNGAQVPVSRLRGGAFSQAVLCYMKEKREP